MAGNKATVRVSRPSLEASVAGIFEKLGIPADEAEDSAKILAAADARGIPSHGVQAVNRYARGISAGLIKGGVTPTVLRETPLSRTLDAEGAMGLSLSKKAMEWAIANAAKHGAGFIAIRNSNHFGIAGYYTEMAARQDCLGWAFSNTAALGVPTWAKDAAFGTNPIAFAAPGLGSDMFSLDMATTTVTRGHVALAEAEGRKIPLGWAVDKNGKATDDPVSLLEDMLYLRGGGLLPLGGEGVSHGGYKGYGLAVMVDIITALLAGGPFGTDVRDSAITSARVSHMFAAVRIDLFRDALAFKTDMSHMLHALKTMPPAEGRERVFYAGLKAHENESEATLLGVPLSETTWKTVHDAAVENGVPPPEVLNP